MKFLRFFFSLLCTLLLFYLLDTRLAEVPLLGRLDKDKKIPAFGRFLNPFGGFWTNAEPKTPASTWKANLPALRDKVEVFFDDKMVPHVFAENEHDLYFMQGYVMAKLRLWQMDFISYAAGGRLSEIMGDRVLRKENGLTTVEYDRMQRRIGMVYGAENALKEIQADSISNRVMKDFTEGINAYISQLAPKDYPLEYKLFNYAPETWTPLKTALILKYMAQDLAMRTDDIPMTNLLETHGKDFVNELFPHGSRYQSPIIPSGTKFDFKRSQLPIPKIPKEISYISTAPKEKERKRGRQAALFNPDKEKENNGSNNWAIAGGKSATGLPMLANDPHLSLNLPSIWFEIQLVTPKLNVYGVAVVGTPCVMIGFNQEVAWGVTNVDADVQDWYKIKFQDSSKKAYLHNKEWKATKKRKESIKIRGGETVEEEIIFTHHGPVVAMAGDTALARKNRVPTESALRWIGHDGSNEFLAVYKMNRAKNYDDYRKAIVHFVSPAQNFIFADVHNDIAITPNGKYPLKWRGQGKFILDGSNPEHDWQGWIPANQNPHIKNPERLFVSSANQFPTDSLYPYYLNWRFVRYDRGARINERLTVMEKANIDSMRSVQNDAFGVLPREVLPTLLKYAEAGKWKSLEQKALEELKKWDYYYKAQKIAPALFSAWWRNLEEAIWADDIDRASMRFPISDRTLEFVMAGDSLGKRWFDNTKTAEKETLADLVIASFKKTIQELEAKFKSNKIEEWTWVKYRNSSIQHLLRLPAFSIQNMVSDGDRTTVNAMDFGNHGPSWRMIVALGRNPKGYGIFPGGQSGNPGSHYYANFVGKWQKGELNELQYMKKAERTSNIVSYWKLSK
jgi:penicillin amidase